MSNSDSSSKRSGVPSWQLQSKPTKSKEPEPFAPESASRETVLEQAEKFLEEDDVRNASTDKKIAFLEGKGLTAEEIEGLLGVSRNPEATAPQSQESSQTPAPAQAPPPSSQTSNTSQQRDTPPIITYPEFLTTAPHATPLVTKSRLLTTLYLFGGLSAILYGTNNYLIEPMLASLTTSRLSLASTTSENLQKLITKLESTVSEIPSSISGDVEVDDESDDDPSEMFHRDIGVQTSLPSSPRPSTPSAERTHFSEQTSRLTSLSTTLTGLVEDSTAEGHEMNDLSMAVNILREYLDGLAYVAPNYGYAVGSYGGLGGSVKDVDDEIGRVKASIRGVKGVLLSARSFPGGGVRAR